MCTWLSNSLFVAYSMEEICHLLQIRGAAHQTIKVLLQHAHLVEQNVYDVAKCSSKCTPNYELH